MYKIILVTILVLLLAGLIFSFSFASLKIETPAYTILKTIGDVEIRQYPQMVVAKTDLQGQSYKGNSSQGFRTIASYIFGGNETREKIAMTAPVVMHLGDSSQMYFVMPGKYKRNDLPKPNSSAVRIEEESEKILAVLRFGGYSDDVKIGENARKLENILRENGIKTKGSLLYMGYNAPWDFINRRNEVALEVILE